MHEIVEAVIKKEVSRKEFLGLVVSAGLSLVGATALLNSFEHSYSNGKTGLDYGEDNYGGDLTNQSSIPTTKLNG